MIPQRETVGTYLTRWLAETIHPNLRPSTARRYEGIVRHQLLPRLGHVRLAKLTPRDVEAMMADVRASGLAVQTALHARAVLRAALSRAERDELVSCNVARARRRSETAKPAPHRVKPAQAREIVASVADPGLRRLVTVALGSGLRQGELLALRWPDVDFERRTLHVGAALVRVGGAYKLAETKSESSKRTVPIGDHVIAALREERQWQVKQQVAARRWRQAIPDLCFTTSTGAPRNGTSVTHAWQDALAATGQPRLRWHDLRAAHGALLLQGKVEVLEISSELGHSHMNVTAKYYVGVAEELGRGAADKLEALIGTG